MPKDTFNNLSEERKIELMTLAGQCLLKMNYDDIRIEDLTDAMGIPVGTFYRYFEDKADAAVYFFSTSIDPRHVPEDYDITVAPEVTKEEEDEILTYNEALSRLPLEVAEKVMFYNLDDYYQDFRKKLVKLKYEGKVRNGLDVDLIAYIYASNVYNLERFFRQAGIEDQELRWNIKKYFYYDFFLYGIMGREPKEGDDN